MAGAFVVGTGRCGSTLVSDILADHGEICSISELLASAGAVAGPGLASHEVTPATEYWRTLTTPTAGMTCLLASHREPSEVLYPLDGTHRYGRDGGVPPIALTTLSGMGGDPDGLLDQPEGEFCGGPPATVADHLRTVAEWVAGREGQEAWVERSGGSGMSVGALASRFPDAKIVHLYRDGVATARSMSRHSLFRLNMIGLELRRATGIFPYRFPLGEVPPCPSPAMAPLWPSTFSATAFDEHRIPPKRFGALWTRMVMGATAQLSAIEASRVMHLRYEDLLDEPHRELSRLAHFLHLSPEKAWLDRSTALLMPGRASAEDPDLEASCRLGARALANLGLPS